MKKLETSISNQNIRCCELFCGIGGMRKGLEQASKRFVTVYANDFDKYACQVYRKNFGDKELYEGDIRAVDQEEKRGSAKLEVTKNEC